MMWKYNDMSNSEIPSRHITWEFALPYILKTEGSLFWKGWSLGCRFLLFGFHYITNVFCGRHIKIGYKKWFLYLDISYGWSLTFMIGLSWIEYMNWSIRRLAKKNPKKIKESITELAALVR